MRYTPLVFLVLAACSSSTDTSPTRYNFAVVDGLNQQSPAGAPILAKKITAQLTRDPQGKFSALDFLLPKLAYAQAIVLSGEPVEGAIVCGREAEPGEPQVIPLCAFTLSDGKAANSVVPGTKAGTYNILFTAQVESQEPVQDSTTVTVSAGPADPNKRVSGPIVFSPAVISDAAVVDVYGNPVPYRIVGDVNISVAGASVGTPEARTITFVPSTNPEGTSGVLELRGADDVLVARMTYRIYYPGSYNQPALSWQTAGTNLTPQLRHQDAPY